MAESAGRAARRLLFVNRFFHPDHSATSQMLTDLAVGLAETRRVTVICSRAGYDGASAGLPAHERYRGVDIHRLPGTSFGRAHLVGRSLDYLTFLRSARRFVAAEAARDTVVVAMTDPPMLGAFIWRAATAHGGLLVQWIQDLFPEIAEEAGVLGRMPGAAPALRRMRNVSLAHSAAVVAVGDAMAEKIRAGGAAARPVEVIPNWADGERVRPIEASRSELRRELGLEGKFVVGYSGNFGRVHEFETLLEAASLLASDSRIRFLMIGGGKRLPAIRQAVSARGLGNVLFAPYQPRESLADALAASDLHFCTLEPRFEGFVVPSKIYGIMAAGRGCLFVGKPDGEIARLVRRGGFGFGMAVGDPGGLAATVRQLADDPAQASALGQAARRLFEREFDRPIAVRKWKDVLERVERAN